MVAGTWDGATQYSHQDGTRSSDSGLLQAQPLMPPTAVSISLTEYPPVQIWPLVAVLCPPGLPLTLLLRTEQLWAVLSPAVAVKQALLGTATLKLVPLYWGHSGDTQGPGEGCKVNSSLVGNTSSLSMVQDTGLSCLCPEFMDIHALTVLVLALLGPHFNPLPLSPHACTLGVSRPW